MRYDHSQQLRTSTGTVDEQVEAEVMRLCGDELGEASLSEVVEEVRASLHEGARHAELLELIALALRSRIDRDPRFSRLAAGAVCDSVYEEVIGPDWADGDFDERYRAAFPERMGDGISAGTLDCRLASYDLERLAQAIDPDRDRLLQYMGVEMLRDRFLIKDGSGRRLETPQYFWMRIAMGLALVEEPEKREHWALAFYDAISSLRSMPSTSPTLYHVGTAHPQAGCYVLSVRDQLGDIFDTISIDAEIASLSAGFGNDWTPVRGTSALHDSLQIESQGPVSFIKVLDSSVAAFNRSGRRHSAACAYLETWHYDIEDFVNLRRTTGDERRRLNDISTANWIPDLFMKRVLADEPWTLFSPDEVPDLHETAGRDFERRYTHYEAKADRGEMRVWKRVSARDLWRQMMTALYATGHPWVNYKDACNLRSAQDHIGPVCSANLCTEIVLNASPQGVGVSTLGSTNLQRHVRDGDLDWDGIAESVRIGVRMLDNAMELSEYPSAPLRDYAIQHRPVGWGVMGFQDALHKLGLDFDSEEALELSDRLLEFVSYHAIDGSRDLAGEKGRYASFEGSKWSKGIFPLDTLDLLEEERGVPVDVDRDTRLDWNALKERVKREGMHNCNVVSIAPTQTLANLAGCFPAIEPAYKQVYVKSNSSGDFTVLNPYLFEELTERGLWSDELASEIKAADGSVQEVEGIPDDVRRRFRGAFDIEPEWVVRHAVKRGKWIDQSQSINLFAHTNDGRVVSELYEQVWRGGLKTTYYLKTLSASTIEKSSTGTVAVAGGAR
jgi:ribonucleoside-diphosphate reductase alpha chain